MAEDAPAAADLPPQAAEPTSLSAVEDVAPLNETVAEVPSPQLAETDQLLAQPNNGSAVSAAAHDDGAGYEDDLPHVDQLPPEMTARPQPTASFLHDPGPAPASGDDESEHESDEESEEELDVDAMQATAGQLPDTTLMTSCKLY
jgi:hypothetical protein